MDYKLSLTFIRTAKGEGERNNDNKFHHSLDFFRLLSVFRLTDGNVYTGNQVLIYKPYIDVS